jgi:transcriptional regulator with XRE-family HTH domain
MSTRGRPSKITFSDRPAWANRLVAARKGAGLSQVKLAELAGLSQSAVADYEVGRSQPSLRVMERIAKALDVEMSFLTHANPVKERGETEEEHFASRSKIPPLVYQDSEANDMMFAKAAVWVDEMMRSEIPHTKISIEAIAFLTRAAWRLSMKSDPGNHPSEKSLRNAITMLKIAQQAYARFPGRRPSDAALEDDDMDETGIDRSDKPD